jgi:hypothetical protein
MCPGRSKERSLGNLHFDPVMKNFWNYRALPSSGFTLVESLAMLATLIVFTMIVAALWLRYQRAPESMPRLSDLTISGLETAPKPPPPR